MDIGLRRELKYSSRDQTKLQRRVLAPETRKKPDSQVPDLTDFMNDMFFGVVNTEKKTYNLTGSDNSQDQDRDREVHAVMDEDMEESLFESSTRSRSNSRMTQEWLEEARRMVASSPSRCDSPSRLVSSPRFAAAAQVGRSSTAVLERRDPLSRSARRHRAVEGFSGEIISKSAKHNRNSSETISTAALEEQLSPASVVQKWFSNILKPSNHNPTASQDTTDSNLMSGPTPSPGPTIPPRQPVARKSRFQTNPSSPRQIPTPSGPNVKNLAQLPNAARLLSPPKNLIESAHRRAISSSTCSIKSSTLKMEQIVNEEEGHSDLNMFLKEQRSKIKKIINGEIDAKAKIILSGLSNSTSSMVAAVCYSWLFDYRMKKDNNKGGDCVVVPVMNVKREGMWKQKQAAWLFYHVGLDANSLLFVDEVALESLMMTGRSSILVVGQEILKTNTIKVGSQCTILTDNYCEDAYNLLQTALLKKLLLAGILLDTKNLNSSSQSSITRDTEAVQLLLVGSNPNYRAELYNQLMEEQRDKSFSEALQINYGNPPLDLDKKMPGGIRQNEDNVQNSDKKQNDPRKTNRDSPKPAKPVEAPVETTAPAKGGKNKFFLAKWFGFGSK